MPSRVPEKREITPPPLQFSKQLGKDGNLKVQKENFFLFTLICRAPSDFSRNFFFARDIVTEKIGVNERLSFLFSGLIETLLHNGSKFKGFQKSKGNSYEVEVVLQFVDEANSYLCGYLKIKGLTLEFPTLTTFFDGEIISKRYPFLTRKWDADEGESDMARGNFADFFFGCGGVATFDLVLMTKSF